jgi:hypothetical protein
MYSLTRIAIERLIAREINRRGAEIAEKWPQSFG